MKVKNKILIIISIILLLVIVVIIFSQLPSNTSKFVSSSVKTTSGDSKISIAEPKSNFDINKEFTFSLLNEKGVEMGKILYTIENAELRDEIIVKGQKATSTKGRTFLIINLKLKNEHNNKIQINTRDFLRLSINNKEEWLAPEIYNDPVEVQPISTKYTRVGFPIDDIEKKFKLQVGEINKEKEVINILFN